MSQSASTHSESRYARITDASVVAHDGGSDGAVGDRALDLLVRIRITRYPLETR